MLSNLSRLLTYLLAALYAVIGLIDWLRFRPLLSKEGPYMTGMQNVALIAFIVFVGFLGLYGSFAQLGIGVST